MPETSSSGCLPEYDRKGLQSAGLREACLFPELFNKYSQALAKIPDFSKSGVEIPEAIQKAYPTVTLQSGAWMVVPFIEAGETGVELAQRILLLRLGIEKSLSAWATYLKEHSGTRFNQFAVFGLPRHIASFSGYSTTLRILRYERAITCTDPKQVTVCEELRAEVTSLSAGILADLRKIRPLKFLDGLSRETSTERVRNESSAEQITEALDRTNLISSLPIIDFQEAFVNLMTGPSPLSPLDGEEYLQLLTSVSILSEMVYMQAWAGERASTDPLPPRPELQSYLAASKSEIEVLMSLVLKALRNEEEPRL
jgi:hypothetical protein